MRKQFKRFCRWVCRLFGWGPKPKAPTGPPPPWHDNCRCMVPGSYAAKRHEMQVDITAFAEDVWKAMDDNVLEAAKAKARADQEAALLGAMYPHERPATYHINTTTISHHTMTEHEARLQAQIDRALDETDSTDIEMLLARYRTTERLSERLNMAVQEAVVRIAQVKADNERLRRVIALMALALATQRADILRLEDKGGFW